MLKKLFYLPTLLFCMVFCCQIALAQTTSATILGTVKDDTGAVLPGVSVGVQHVDTGTTRTIVTDDQGRYRVSNLALGNYEAQAELAGFQTAVRSGIKLSVGQEAVVDFTMQVGQISEKVVVTGEAALVQTTTSTMAALVDDKQIRDLPLNGRDFSQLATLQAGVYAPPTMGRQINAVAGAGPRISISGARPNQNSFRLDGSDVQDAQHRTPAGVSGTTLGVEGVREFTVLTNIYSAEYGERSGGVINAVTKSGTNAFHGSVFEFHRNDNLDARDFFDRRKPEFKRNQFGFTAGGPIRKDRTFFFGSYEGLRDRLGLTTVETTLTAAAHQGIFPNRVIPIEPRAKPYVDLYPLPDGRDLGGGLGEFIRSVSRPTDEDYFLVKVDHTLSTSDSLFVRYISDDSSIVVPQPFPGFENVGQTERRFTTIEERKVFSPTLLNEFRLSFNRNVVGTVSQQTLNLDPALSFSPGREFGGIQVGGLSSYGYSWMSDRVLTSNVFEYIDNVSYNRAGHSLRFGAEVKRTQFNTLSAFARNGFYRFASIEDFFRARPLNLDIMLPDSDPQRGYRVLYFGAFVQDDLKLTPTLTLNLGIRYEFTTEPTEVNGKLSTLVNFATDKEMTVRKTLYENPCLKCFAPRVGFAWDMFGNGKTALRGGFGIFYSVLIPIDWIYPATNPPPFYKRTSLSDPYFPSATEAIARELARSPNLPFFIQTLGVDVSQPYMYKYNLNIQRQIGTDLVLSIGYAGSRGVHIGREEMTNIRQFQVLPDGRKYFPAGAARQNPAFGAISWVKFDTNTLYNALQVSASKRFSRGYHFQVAYTFAKGMDASTGTTGSGEVPGSTTGTADPFDWKRDWGRAGFDVHNVATATFTYELPKMFSGMLNSLLDGWQLNGILTLADGTPATFTNTIERGRSGILAPSGGHERPDLRSGGNGNPVVDTRSPDKYWDGSQLQLQEAGFFGNLGKATGTGPGVATFDFSTVKSFSFGENRSLQLRSEFFNIFNRPNFGMPNTSAFVNTSGIPSGTFGRITTTTTTSRQIQFGLKFLF